MIKTMNKISKYRVKESLLKGNSKAKALLDAGYSEASAKHHARERCQKVLEEIEREFKASELSVEMVLKRIDEDRALAQEKGDISTALQADIALGKYLAMFTDKTSGTIAITEHEKVIDTIFNNRLLDVTPSKQ